MISDRFFAYIHGPEPTDARYIAMIEVIASMLRNEEAGAWPVVEAVAKAWRTASSYVWRAANDLAEELA